MNGGYVAVATGALLSIDSIGLNRLPRSCFNAFSRVDVRVEVKIPGGVDAYIIDLRGERHELTPRLWTEVYLSAVLRAILYADDPSYRLAGYRKLDPIRQTEDEMRFLAAAEQCFAQAWQLGSDPEIQVATSTSNHLASGLMKYFGDAFRFGAAVNLFEKLVMRDGEIASLLARSYLGMSAQRAPSRRHSLSSPHRRRGQGRPDPAPRLARIAAVLLPPPRPGRVPPRQGVWPHQPFQGRPYLTLRAGTPRVGAQAGQGRRQLRALRVCHLVKAYRDQHGAAKVDRRASLSTRLECLC